MKQNRPVFIGITGGVGAGKSEILHFIKRHYKCRIYLADEVGHLVKKQGTECYRRLVDLLGNEVLDNRGEIDKARMAEMIFQDEDVLRKVNDIIHPAVRIFLMERLEEAAQEKDVELFFVEAALLIECGYKELVDQMWYVYADPAIRRQRLADSRGYSPEKIDGIMQSQLSDEKFRQNCDFVIDNSGKLTDSYEQIKKRLETYTWLE